MYFFVFFNFLNIFDFLTKVLKFQVELELYQNCQNQNFILGMGGAKWKL